MTERHDPASRAPGPTLPAVPVSPLRVLLVEDSDDDAMLIERELGRGKRPANVVRVEDADGMRDALTGREWDVVLCDWRLPTFSATAALELLRTAGLDIPFIIVSGTIDDESAVSALHAGASDFLLKSKLPRLLPAIEREIRERAVRVARHQAEEQLRQAQKLEAIGSLVGGIAHDFNNMLSVILSYAALVLETLPQDEPCRDDILEIRRAGERAAEMTRQLLTFSRKQVLRPRVLDLAELLTRMEKMLRRVLGAEVELSWWAPPVLGRVRADPGQLEQVVMNLVLNARDAMPGGGQASIEASEVALDAQAASTVGLPPGPYIRMTVADSGVGMDEGTRARIFEPFFTTKEPGQGTGLGLSSVFGIIKQTGGHISARSELGHGSVFEVLLPRADGGCDATLEPVVEPVALRGTETVLVVEDDDQVRQLVRTVLRRHGYTVHDAQNGGEAFLLSEQLDAPVHLLLTDLVMPRLGGKQVAERLIAARPDMKVLFMSTYERSAADALGPAAFLSKPFTPADLLRKVRAVLEA